MLTGLGLIIVTLILVVTYMIGTGISVKLLYAHTSLDWGDSVGASVAMWYLIIPILAGIALAKVPQKIHQYRKKLRQEVKKVKELSPIHIKKGAKITTMQEYKQLKQLCIDFEIEFEANQEVNKLIGI